MCAEHNKIDGDVIDAQMEFFRRGRSGCTFASWAAKDPSQFEWDHVVVRGGNFAELEAIIDEKIACAQTSTLSLMGASKNSSSLSG